MRLFIPVTNLHVFVISCFVGEVLGLMSNFVAPTHVCPSVRQVSVSDTYTLITFY